jgi:membrane associated rhomboid family serine protease
MTPSPVGMRCPECAGQRRGPARAASRAVSRATPVVTIGLIVVNVLAFALEAGGDQTTEAYQRGALYGSKVADGEWWRIVTSGFLHASIGHIVLNMLALWFLGSALELYVGPFRYAAIYLLGLLGGAAGALLTTNPHIAVVGASGAIFGLMGALLVAQRRGAIYGPILPLLALNLIITISNPNISLGGHVGGFIGGLLAALALDRVGGGHIAYGRRIGVSSIALAAIGIGELLVAAAAVR